MSETTNSQAAPGALEFLRAFANTLELDPPQDALANPEALHYWLFKHKLLAQDEDVSEADWRRVLKVREAVRQLLQANAGEPLEPEALKLLNTEAKRAPLVVHLTEGEARLEPAEKGVERLLGRLFALSYEAKLEGTWTRLKLCANDECQWAFYDHSKNRSGKWCSMETCGCRMKTRAYRQRQAAAD